MNTILKKIPILFIFFGATACSKDELSNQLKDRYESSRMEFSDLRIFTRNGEILDSSLKNKIIERYKQLNTFDFAFLEEDRKIKVDETSTLIFQSNSASITSADESDEYSYQIADSFIRFIQSQEVSYITSNDNFVTDRLVAHQPLHNAYETIPTTTGFSTKVTERPERYARIQSSQLRFPLIEFFLYSNNSFSNSLGGGISIQTANSINNELNENVFSELSENDKLLVQQNWLIFE